METIQNYAVVLMIITVVSETIYSSIHNLELFDIKDSLTNILLGVFTIFISLVMKYVMFGVFTGIHHVALFNIAFTWWAIMILFLISDLHYYWFHRLSHSSRFFWASHVVHHSSKKYNLTVAIRLPFTNGFYRFLFWSPLCFAGFSPVLVFLMDGIVVYYTFFVHTETIGKLGVLEYFLNTPSHHRVHHSSNPKYVDKNYAGVLIIWDRLFGTFVSEEEKPHYGLTKPFHTYNPVKIIFDEYRCIVTDLKQAGSARDVFKIIFGHPSYRQVKKHQRRETSMQHTLPLKRELSF